MASTRRGAEGVKVALNVSGMLGLQEAVPHVLKAIVMIFSVKCLK